MGRDRRTDADRRTGEDVGEASPRADLAGGWGAAPSDEADRMTTSTDRRALSHYMVEIAAGCGAIMPQIMPRRS